MGKNQKKYKMDLVKSQIDFMRRWSASPAQMQAFTTCAIVWDETGRGQSLWADNFNQAIEQQFGEHGLRYLRWMKSQNMIGTKMVREYKDRKRPAHTILDLFEEWAYNILDDNGDRYRPLEVKPERNLAILRSSYRVEKVERPTPTGTRPRTDYYVKVKDYADIVSGKWIRDNKHSSENIVQLLEQHGADGLLIFKAKIYEGKPMPEWLRWDVKKFMQAI